MSERQGKEKEGSGTFAVIGDIQSILTGQLAAVEHHSKSWLAARNDFILSHSSLQHTF